MSYNRNYPSNQWGSRSQYRSSSGTKQFQSNYSTTSDDYSRLERARSSQFTDFQSSQDRNNEGWTDPYNRRDDQSQNYGDYRKDSFKEQQYSRDSRNFEHNTRTKILGGYKGESFRDQHYPSDSRTFQSSTGSQNFGGYQKDSFREQQYSGDSRTFQSNTGSQNLGGYRKDSFREQQYPSDSRNFQSNTGSQNLGGYRKDSFREQQYPSDSRNFQSNTGSQNLGGYRKDSFREEQYSSDSRTFQSNTGSQNLGGYRKDSFREEQYPSDSRTLQSSTGSSQQQTKERSAHSSGVTPMNFKNPPDAMNFPITTPQQALSESGTDDSPRTDDSPDESTSNPIIDTNLYGTKYTAKDIKDLPNDMKHLCEVCKVVILKQDYEKHMNSENHMEQERIIKGKELMVSSNPIKSGYLKCPLCNVYCSDRFTYRSHVRGKYHQKALKMFKDMGKPIPNCHIMNVCDEAATRTQSVGEEFVEIVGADRYNCTLCQCQLNGLNVSDHCKGKIHRLKYSDKLREEKTNKIKEETKVEEVDVVMPFFKDDPTYWKTKQFHHPVRQLECELCKLFFPNEFAYGIHLRGNNHFKEVRFQRQYCGLLLPKVALKEARHKAVSNTPLMGEKYIIPQKTVVNESGKCDMFCTLCNMGLNAKVREDHMRSVRHATAYKEKVDPNFVFEEVQVNKTWKLFVHDKQKSLKDKKLQKQNKQNSFITDIDKLIRLKEVEQTAFEKLISDCVKCLQQYCKDNESNDFNKEKMSSESNIGESCPQGEKNNDTKALTIIAVVRTGNFPKNIMLTNDEKTLFLSVLTEEIPTKMLLLQFFQMFNRDMQNLSENNLYDMDLVIKDATITVKSKSEPKADLNIVFTSAALNGAFEGENVLVNEELGNCVESLKALVELRRARWFKEKMEKQYIGVKMIRVLRAMSKQEPSWSLLSSWVCQLLVHHAVSTEKDLCEVELIRKVFAAVASGMLLPNSVGIPDPCEEKPTDAINYLTHQQREDLTTSAKDFLSVLNSNEICDVLFQTHMAYRLLPSNTEVQPKTASNEIFIALTGTKRSVDDEDFCRNALDGYRGAIKQYDEKKKRKIE